MPSRFEAPVTATHLVRSSISSMTRAGSRMPVAGSNGASTCSAPAASHARRHGVTLASWSRRVPTTRSPGRSVTPTARVKAKVRVVMLAPKQTPSAEAPSRAATLSRVRSSSASQASAALNEPPALALLPLDAQSVIASIAVSTICVPAGPSKRAHPSRTPGNRARQEPSTMPGACHRSARGVVSGPGYSRPVPSTPDDKLPIKMLNDRLLVRIPDKDGERRSQGGILIPATAQMAKRLVWAEVVAQGANVRAAEVGDLVLFSPEDRYEVEVQGADYIMLRERDLHAVAAERIEASTGLYL